MHLRRTPAVLRSDLKHFSRYRRCNAVTMELMSASQCLAYVVAVNVVTAVWVAIAQMKSLNFNTLAMAMYLPTIFAIFFCNNIAELVLQVLGLHQLTDSLVYSAVSIYVVVALVGACVVLDLLMGWADLNRDREYPAAAADAVHAHNKEFFWGFLRASGEEVGWRCFLLPSLMAHFSPGVSLMFSGAAWGLFHVPVLVLMTSRLSPPRPWVTVFVQCLAVALNAFPHGYVAIKSGYSVWASGLMHSVWNKINPIILGSIYTQTPGAVRGEQWLINGEGAAGCIITLPLAVWIAWTL